MNRFQYIHFCICALVVTLYSVGCTYNAPESSSPRALPTIHFSFTEEELAFLQKPMAEVVDKDRLLYSPVVIAENSDTAVYAGTEVHIRGQHSRLFVKKSLSISLPGKVGFADAVGQFKDFYLISLTMDSGSINNEIGYSILAGAGLFPGFFKMVRVEFNGVYQGLYLLVEQPQDALRHHNNSVPIVFRRGYGTSLETQYVAPSYSARIDIEMVRLSSRYTIGASLFGAAAYDSLSSIMNVEQYCRWLAVNEMVRNGDYSDEMYFYGREGGVQGLCYDVMGFDYDDLFQPPHGNSAFEGSLIYCKEDILDSVIGSDPFLYAIYLQELRFVCNALLDNASLERIRVRLEREVLNPFSDSATAVLCNNFTTPDANVHAELAALIDRRIGELSFRRDSISGILDLLGR